MTHQLPDELADGELEEILVRFAGQYNVFAHAAHTDNNQPYPCLEEAKALIATHAAKAIEANLTSLLSKEEDMGIGIPVIRVSDVRDALAQLTGGHNE